MDERAFAGGVDYGPKSGDGSPITNSRTHITKTNTDSGDRTRFRRWLHQHRQLAKRLPLPALLNRSGIGVSLPSAYRIAVAAGLRGKRFNYTRYEQFWRIVNWDLPDGVLHDIWGVSRQNIRLRRIRLTAGGPKFRRAIHRVDQRFLKAANSELKKAARYDGPLPR